MNPRKPVALLLLHALLASSAFLLAQQGPGNAPIVLRGATVINGSGDAPLAGAVIVIEGERRGSPAVSKILGDRASLFHEASFFAPKFPPTAIADVTP